MSEQQEKKLTFIEKIRELAQKKADKERQQREDDKLSDNQEQNKYYFGVDNAKQNLKNFSQGIQQTDFYGEMIPPNAQPPRQQGDGDIFKEMAARYAASEHSDILPNMTANFKAKYANTEQKIKSQNNVYKYKEAELHNHFNNSSAIFRSASNNQSILRHTSSSYHRPAAQVVSRMVPTKRAFSTGKSFGTSSRRKKMNVRKFL